VNYVIGNSTDLLVWGIIGHLVADWLFQTEWMSVHKNNLAQPAAWVHGGVHVLVMLLMFPPYLAILIGLTHVLIDSRTPVLWWMKTVKQISDPGKFEILVIGMDQVFHVVVLALVVLIFQS
jgi:hypothetical protein